MTEFVYKYGLLDPTLNTELVDEQIWLGHRYRNKLTEIERWRRSKIRPCYENYYQSHPVIGPHEERVAELRRELEEARAKIKCTRKKTRSRSETDEDRERAKSIRAQLKEARVELKAAKQLQDHDEQLSAQTMEINKEATKRRKRAYADARPPSGNLYWGTCLIHGNAADQASKQPLYDKGSPNDPVFKRWTGSGAIAVQLQKGRSWERACSGDDRQIRVDLSYQPVPGRGGGWRPRVRVRVGSDGIKPIWAEWPVILHRPVPDDAKIMWAKVIREKLAGKHRWSLHLTLRLDPAWRKEPCGAGVVALDLGWRKFEDGLRVGYLRDDDDEEEDVRLDSGIIDRVRKVHDLTSIRDKLFNRARDEFAKWRKTLDHNEGTSWLLDITNFISQWRSQARLASVAIRWCEHRFDGDEDALDTLEVWRKKDKHLWLWECNLRDKVLRRRREQYRVLGAKLSRRYRVLVIEDFDLRKPQRHQPPESDKVEIKKARAQQPVAAPSELRQCLVQAFAARGGTVAEVDPAYTTRQCHVCGEMEIWDQIKELNHKCGDCGVLWDQDDNACKHLLERYQDHLKGDKESGVVRVKDYSIVVPRKPSKWARRKQKKNGDGLRAVQ